MTITVDLAPEMEEQVAAQARVRGLSIDAYIQEIVALSSQSPKLSTEELNRLLDEAAEVVFDGPPLSDFAMSRESIYTREDEL